MTNYTTGQKFTNVSGNERTFVQLRNPNGKFTNQFGIVAENRTTPYMFGSYVEVLHYMKNSNFSPNPPLPALKTFRCKLYWEMCVEVEVAALNEEDAATLAENGPLPSSDTWQYVMDSANVEIEDVVEVK